MKDPRIDAIDAITTPAAALGIIVASCSVVVGPCHHHRHTRYILIDCTMDQRHQQYSTVQQQQQQQLARFTCQYNLQRQQRRQDTDIC